MQCICDNCRYACGQSKLKPIRNFFQRTSPGGEVPAGECPKCGALSYVKKASNPLLCILIVVEGGAVQDVFVEGDLRFEYILKDWDVLKEDDTERAAFYARHKKAHYTAKFRRLVLKDLRPRHRPAQG